MGRVRVKKTRQRKNLISPRPPHGRLTPTAPPPTRAAGLFSFCAKRQTEQNACMADGIGAGRGYDLVVDEKNRSFRDTHQAAVEAAIYLKQCNKAARVQIRNCETGNVETVLEDGRLGSFVAPAGGVFGGK